MKKDFGLVGPFDINQCPRPVKTALLGWFFLSCSVCRSQSENCVLLSLKVPCGHVVCGGQCHNNRRIEPPKSSQPYSRKSLYGTIQLQLAKVRSVLFSRAIGARWSPLLLPDGYLLVTGWPLLQSSYSQARNRT